MILRFQDECNGIMYLILPNKIGAIRDCLARVWEVRRKQKKGTGSIERQRTKWRTTHEEET